MGYLVERFPAHGTRIQLDLNMNTKITFVIGKRSASLLQMWHVNGLFATLGFHCPASKANFELQDAQKTERC